MHVNCADFVTHLYLYCTFPMTSMSIGFQADRTVVGRNDRLGLLVVARNDSTSKVKELTIEIKQKVAWYAHRHKATSKRTVAKIAVSGSQLGPVAEGADERPDKDRSLAVVANAAQAELQELLTSGGGVRHELIVPEEKCSDSLRVGNIMVRHSLDVCLKTGTCITSPELSMPLVVQRMSAGPAEAAGTSAAAPPPQSLDAAVPVAMATSVPLDAHWNPTPVQVPNSAVKLETEGMLTPPHLKCRTSRDLVSAGDRWLMVAVDQSNSSAATVMYDSRVASLPRLSKIPFLPQLVLDLAATVRTVRKSWRRRWPA